jgi:hypothetical protein
MDKREHENGIEGAARVSALNYRRVLDFDPRTAAIRLHIANQDLWADYDRLKSEAELKLTISRPLAIFGLIVSFENAWWAGGAVLLLTVILYRMGDLRARLANGVLVQCLLTGVIADSDLLPTSP